VNEASVLHRKFDNRGRFPQQRLAHAGPMAPRAEPVSSFSPVLVGSNRNLTLRNDSSGIKGTRRQLHLLVDSSSGHRPQRNVLPQPFRRPLVGPTYQHAGFNLAT
jgi:hypothetical protein